MLSPGPSKYLGDNVPLMPPLPPLIPCDHILTSSQIRPHCGVLGRRELFLERAVGTY